MLRNFLSSGPWIVCTHEKMNEWTMSPNKPLSSVMNERSSAGLMHSCWTQASCQRPWFFPWMAIKHLLNVKVTQSCPTLCNSMDCSPPGSSVHGILQARRLEWVVIPFSRASSQPRDQTLLHWQAGSLALSHLGSPIYWLTCRKSNSIQTLK